MNVLPAHHRPGSGGLTGTASTDIPAFVDRFPIAMFVAAGVTGPGGPIGVAGIRSNVLAEAGSDGSG
jgi:hypothetical protein